MKISPTAIRQKFFDTSFRGFEKKQVTDFLEEISEIMQKINQENLELRSKLQHVESEFKRLKDVEDSLFRTMKTAEETGNAIINEATEAADQIIEEANQIAESTTTRAYQYADQLKKKAEENAQHISSSSESKIKETFKEINQRLHVLIKSHNSLVEQREALLQSLKKISQDTLTTIELSETGFSPMESEPYLSAMEELRNSDQFTSSFVSSSENDLKSSTPHVEDGIKSQFEEGMIPSTLDQDTNESMEVIYVESETQSEFPAEEKQHTINTALSKNPDFSDERVVRDKKFDAIPDTSIRSSGSFFDQFD